MPKIPDISSYGARPTPQPGSVPNIVGTRASIGEGVARGADIMSRDANQVGSDTASFAAGMEQAGERIAAADKRITSRLEAVERARQLNAFQEENTTELLNLSKEQNFADPAVLKQFSEKFKSKSAALVGQHAYSGESKAILAENLEAIRFRTVSQAAAMQTAYQEKELKGRLSSDLSALTAATRQSPAALVQSLAAWDYNLKSYAGGLDPAEERAQQAIGASAITEAAIEPLITSGRVDLAEQLLLSTPGLLNKLSPAAQSKLFNGIDAYRAEARKPRPPVALSPGQVLVDPATGREIARGGPKEEKLVEIYDENSPTKSRMVPESEARGQPGRERTPVVSITQQGESAVAKELGQLDAKRVVKAEADAQQAFLDKAEVQRMTAALDSGKFTPGVFSDARHFMARLADFAGAGPEIKNLVGDAATADTLDAASAKLGVAIAEKMGRFTNMSLQFVKDSVPNLARTPEGNRVLLEVMNRTADRQIEVASMADKFIQRYGTLRPKDEKTYFQALRDLEENDPLITPELEKRIKDGSKQTGGSFVEKFGAAVRKVQKGDEVINRSTGERRIWDGVDWVPVDGGQ